MHYDYPELYYRIYPKVISAVNEHLDDNCSMEKITREQMEKMVDDIYIKMVHEYPEIHEDPYERKYRGRVRAEQRPFFGRSRITRDLITILLISELFRRNRSFFPL
ncbi:hypothetical protein CIW83_12485 [Tissierella sp. P1]|jgi:hypothetical protein|uniref:hypothetical protein n=1 Tax=Tissierella TaxID=41273 RepID=UPI000BA0046D|nr:hypothetical protein [Tissierella sp. P1]MDU5080875.1 hypothetical protein [Bacillota bacterium]OZV11853.1 hypothetical protein CIW83_12485 [Tissierella sp. P1]